MLTTSACDRLCVVLVATRNPLNMGAAARAMSNFGFLRLRVVNPYEAAFRAARSAVGASAVLQAAQEYGSVAEAVADCSLVVGTTAAGSRRQLQLPLETLAAGALSLRQHVGQARAALLFGSEKRGLSNEEMSHCDFLLHIPTRAVHPSMNLGQAVAVTLYELAREAEAPVMRATTTPATAGELERINALLSEALERSGYLPAEAPAALLGGEQEKVRRVLHRLRIAEADAHLLTGMLRQILWKLRKQGERDRCP